MTAQQAASYIRWYGKAANYPHGDGDREKFELAVKIVRAVPHIMTIPKGVYGAMHIIAVCGEEVAYRDSRDPGDWGCHFCKWSIGGLFQPVAQTMLGKGSPSQYISGLYAGGALALTQEDAEKLGIQCEAGQLDPPEVALLFGSNASTV